MDQEAICREAGKKLADLRAECPHFFEPLSKKDLDDEYMSVGAFCLACKQDFGWRCKESPDGCCHYYTEDDGLVHLNNGQKVDPTGLEYYPGSEYETDDCCVFCGSPDERK